MSGHQPTKEGVCVRFLFAAFAELLLGDRFRTKVNVDIHSLESLTLTADEQHPNPQEQRRLPQNRLRGRIDAR